ncbi:MAG: methylmalonate-semialdehyde dehydrogenase (CoA acylating) [Acidobacteria bacterium]|jgi:malonate-semialdehyde dehydrogenase (acetylating)/methylmalonate-semialdehyde dehydrogenase|nr:MAG: methylmalonate-semialdehyde dehydrogenase (CoA acylating) [Acidobacteriota bacterium]
MIATETTVRTLKFYVNGKWEAAAGSQLHPVMNPATGEVIARVPYATAEQVDRVARAAHEGFLKWRETPVVDRVQVLYRYKALLDRHADEVARILSTENGKTLEDAKGSVRRAIQMVEVACGMPTLMMGDSLENVSRGIDSQTIRQPLGVCAGITPFNFPAMVPMWMFPFAIACGNSFILKPSEKVPLTPTRTAELLDEAGIPAGVFNLIHGDKVAVDALLEHPLVRAISFVGSSPVAKYVYENAAKHGKRVQALGGAKNHLVVMPDANLEKTVEAIMGSAFGAAGERCLAGSVLVPVGGVAQPLLDLLLAKAKSMHIGDGTQPGVDMGPLVTDAHRKKVVGYIEKGVAEGATPLCDGRDAAKEGGGFFVGPTIFDNVKPQMTIAKEEIFGPVLSVIRVKSLDEAIELVNSSKFGNTTSIFTADGKSAREFASRIECGMVGVNIGVAAPMAFFPFSGWKNSFFGDLHAHGKDAIAFYTEQKVVMTRWF